MIIQQNIIIHYLTTTYMKILDWTAPLPKYLEQTHHNQLPIRTSWFWTDPKSVSESQYTNTNQPKPDHTVPNNNLFYTPRNQKTAKAENRSSLKRKQLIWKVNSLFETASEFKTNIDSESRV